MIFGDLGRLLLGASLKLDEAEAEALGGPEGETISIWAAVSARHGVLFARLTCLGLWIIQARHCEDQLNGVSMSNWSYLKALILLVAFVPIAASIGLFRWAFVQTPLERSREINRG